LRLLTCSNSAPAPPAPPGGLVPILNALLKELGGRWVFTAPEGFDPASVTGLRAAERSHWYPVSIPKHRLDQQRQSVSVGVLLWLFHYLYDTSMIPLFDDRFRSAWRAYKLVNQEFAAALLALHENSTDEVVLINDFHLMLVPSLFSMKAPRRNSCLAYFHHVPWCEPDYFGILPASMREQLLESLLNCDFVGFHCERWGQSFLACCDRYLPGARINGRRVHYRDRETRITAAAGPIDAAKLDELAADPRTHECREVLLCRAEGRRIITRIDRLDLWKNLPRGFLAYETLLRRKPELAADVWFCAIVSRPRFATDRHRRYESQCEEVVRRINTELANGRESVSLLFPEGGFDSRHRAVAALQAGVTTLVNPTYDGLNMVAKESAVVNPRARLMLSTNAGAFPQLASIAIPVHPFDILSTADALEQALEDRTQPADHDFGACSRVLRHETAKGWLETILGRSQPG